MFRDMGALADECVAPLVDATKRYLAAAIPAGEYVGWLASPADGSPEIVAGAGLQLRRVLPRPAASGTEISLGPQGLVLNVFTEPSWRRRGAAELLMRHVLAWASANGVDSLVLHASADGRALYERLGFEATNEMRYAGALRPPPRR
jgi:GNAT superfamily N-acetyltransferase